jgi:succinoglycan biosynthesis protein ExoV
MPHINHSKMANDAWLEVCRQIGWRYIDPSWEIQQVLDEIAVSRVLATEAMHGAIVADALGVPWVPVITSPGILTFKWQDWCSSIGLPYRPNYIMPLWKLYPPAVRGFRSAIAWGSYGWAWLSQNYPLARLAWEQQERDWLGTQLMTIEKRGESYLSSDERLEELTLILEEKLSYLTRQ